MFFISELSILFLIKYFNNRTIYLIEKFNFWKKKQNSLDEEKKKKIKLAKKKKKERKGNGRTKEKNSSFCEGVRVGGDLKTFYLFIIIITQIYCLPKKYFERSLIPQSQRGKKIYSNPSNSSGDRLWGGKKKNLIFKQKKRFPIINSLGISWNMHILKNKKSWNILRSLSLHLQTGVLSSNFDPD